MRTKLNTLMLLVSVLLVFAAGRTAAQTEFKPTNAQLFYTYTITSANAFANSDTDTLPSPTGSDSAAVRLGAASFLQLETFVSDSAAVDITIQESVIGSGVWTTIKSDSVIHTGTGGYRTTTVALQNTETRATLNGKYRVIYAFRAAANSANSGAYYNAKWVWKP